MIDLYCERAGAGFWAEPLNAVTNVAFVLVAVWVWKVALTGRRAPALSLVAALIATIGLGSFLFHTLATPSARILDIGSIGLFEAVFLGLYIRHVLGWSRTATAAALAALGASVGAAQLAPDFLNGSLSYAPGLAALFGIGVADSRAARPAPRMMMAAGIVFAGAVALRSADMALCASVTSGTHFLWHIGAATVTAIVALAYAHNANA